jgi:hypothetical protein
MPISKGHGTPRHNATSPDIENNSYPKNPPMRIWEGSHDSPAWVPGGGGGGTRPPGPVRPVRWAAGPAGTPPARRVGTGEGMAGSAEDTGRGRGCPIGGQDATATPENKNGGAVIGTAVQKRPPPGTALREPCRAAGHEWRWRESNPRPSSSGRGFSGRSLLCFSRPRRSRRRVADGLSHCQVSRSAPWPGRTVEPPNDARHRAGGDPGLTVGLTRLYQAARASSRWLPTVALELALIFSRSQDLRGHDRSPRPASLGTN